MGNEAKPTGGQLTRKLDPELEALWDRLHAASVALSERPDPEVVKPKDIQPISPTLGDSVKITEVPETLTLF